MKSLKSVTLTHLFHDMEEKQNLREKKTLLILIH